MVGITRPAASHEVAAGWVDGSSAAAAYLMGMAEDRLASSQQATPQERQRSTVKHWDLLLINLWEVLCPFLRSRDLVCVGGVSREVRGVVRGGTKDWDLSFTRTNQQTLSLVRGGGVLPPLVCVWGSVRHLKLGPLGTDDGVMRALALQPHTHHDTNHTQQGAAASLPLPAAPQSHAPLPACSLLSLDVQCCGGLTAAPLTALLHRCGSLTRLDVQKCYGLGGDACLPSLLNHCPALKHLNLRLAFKCGGISLMSVAQSCRHLTHLDLRACKGVEDCGLLALAQHCPQLQHLDLWLCEKVTDTGVCAIGEACEELSWLRLRGCNRLTSRSLLSLCDGSSGRLTLLDLQHCPLITQPCVRPLFQVLRHHSGSLFSLSLAYNSDITDALVQALLAPLSPLVQEWALCPVLCYLNVSYCPRLSPSLLLSLAQQRTARLPAFTLHALTA